MTEARTRSAFYLYLGVFFLAVALTGFAKTFFVPLARGSFSAPWIIYAHGACLFAWLLLFIAQSVLVRLRKIKAHRLAGQCGAVLALAIFVSGYAVGAFATRRDLAAGETWPYGAFVNTVIEMIVFGTLVGLALRTTHRPESHIRYLVLAMITVLGPAWFRFRRFMPFVPHPIVTFSLIADSLWPVVMLRDYLTLRRIHPVYLIAGSAMFAIHLIELTADGSQLWYRIGRFLIDRLG